MSTLPRRDFLKIAGASGAALAAGSVLSPTVRRVRAQSATTAGRVFSVTSGPVTLHTYVSPEASVSVTTHIVETANQLIVIDGQFLKVFAQEAAAFVGVLGKPVSRFYLSHEHPDHWLGADNFGLPMLTTDTIAANVATNIANGAVENTGALVGADQMPTTPIIPTGGVVAGSETIDGVTLEFEVIQNAEAPEQIVFKFPEAGIAILQDLLYSDVHAFPLPTDRAGWTTALGNLSSLAADGYSILGAGHGYLSGLGALDEVLDYIAFQGDVIASAASVEEATARLVEAYPNYGGQFILTFLSFLFQQQ